MKNAFTRIGRTCVSLLVAGGLAAVAMLAGPINPVYVTLPHSVAVGSATLPAGDYTISSMSMADGDMLFVLRSEHGSPVTLAAQRIEGDAAEKTNVLFSTDGDAWHFDKLFIEGDSTGYQFINSK